MEEFLMPSSSRIIALNILLRVMEGAAANVVLEQSLQASNLPAVDRGLVTELVDGTLHWQGRLDYQLQALLNRQFADLPRPIQCILRLGAYQITLLTRIPGHAAVNEAVALARQYGHAGTAALVNAVLRKLQAEQEAIMFPDSRQDPAGYLAAAYSHPPWLVKRWLSRFGFAETEALLKANNTPPPLTLRVNRRWITRDGLRNFLEMHGVISTPTLISPSGLTVISGGNPRELDEYREGLFSIQGEGSMIMAELLRPEKNYKGWDLTAGVGGKTTYLAELVDDTGSLLATDTSAERLEVLAHENERLGLTSITAWHGDARQYPLEAKSMDFALLDAPCSGTGSLQRHADARWKKIPEQFTNLTLLQNELLETAARAVKSGGVILYCTCSLEPEENEEIVQAFLSCHSQWSLSPQGPKHRTLPDDAKDPAGYVRLLTHRHGTDGFFAARLQKTDEG